MNFNEFLNEKVTVLDNRYVRSHGKSPKGWGKWMFSYDEKGDNMFEIPGSMSYTDAKKWVMKKAKEDGESYVYVMESNDRQITEEEGRDTLAELNEMTMGQLERIEDYAEMIAERMEQGQQLESWMFSQITVALENLNSVHDAMDGGDGVEESVELNEKMKILMKSILLKMIPSAFGPSSPVSMRKELETAISNAIKPILVKYDYVVEQESAD